MNKKIFLFSLPLLLFAISCGTASCGKIQQQLNKHEPIVLTKTEQAIANDVGDFAFRLFKQVAAEEEKAFFISPFSASLALSMTANGTAGETAAQMKKVLGFAHFSYEDMNGYFAKLSEKLPKADKLTTFTIANSLWTRKGFPVHKEYKQLLKKWYKAQAEELDFNSPQAVKTINNWCSNHTNGLIDKILDEVEPSMVAYLINALYFKGTWVHSFEKKNSFEGTFYPDYGPEKDVVYMQQKKGFPYVDTEWSSVASFPYGNESFSMIVLLPKEGVSVNQVVEKQLNPDTWSSLMDKLQNHEKELNVVMPKFKSEFEKDLIPTLKAMGMVLPFLEGLADFSNLSPVWGLYIGMVKQKTYIEVHEKGAEAAAVTAVGIAKTSLNPLEPVPFIMNKSFVYAIVEKSTGALLFMGKQ